MTNDKISKQRYDLEERTARFGKAIIKFAQQIPRNPVTVSLITQLVRSGTSVGSNYCEADNAESRKDFVHKISICKKESKETKHWLIMVTIADATLQEQSRVLLQETQELNLIFNAIIHSTRKKN